jgi:hypothetical protein
MLVASAIKKCKFAHEELQNGLAACLHGWPRPEHRMFKATETMVLIT